MSRGYELTPSTTVFLILFYVVALVCTVARVLYRLYTRRFWWEDIWATLAGVLVAVGLVGLRVYDFALDPSSAQRNLISGWLASLSITLGLWATRLSIFVSLIRVSNPSGRSRQIALACVASFIITALALTGQKIYYCVMHRCSMSVSVAIAQLVTDIISDAILVLAPIPLLRDVHLSKNRRILITSAFSSSILMSAVSITHSILMLIYSTNAFTLIFAELKAALSLLICNILVIVTFTYRVLSRRGSSNKRQGGIDLDASFGQTSPLNFTSIDLNQLTADTLTGSCGDAVANSTSYTTSTNHDHDHIPADSVALGPQGSMASRSQGSSNDGYPSTTDDDDSESLEMTKSMPAGDIDPAFECAERRLGVGDDVC